MATRTYRLKIVREGREFEAEGDKAFVLDMLKRFSPQGAEEPVVTSVAIQPGKGKSAATAAIAARAGGKSVSIREFVQQLEFKKHTDITLAFGYYLEKYLGAPEFTPGDINNCYYDAKQERSNTSQMIVQNIKRGFMMPSKKKGENRYTLTASGEKFIESKLVRPPLEENHGESCEGDKALAIGPVGV